MQRDKLLREMADGKFTDFCTNTAQPVEAGRRKIAGQIELIKQGWLGRRHLSRGRAAVKFAQEFQ